MDEWPVSGPRSERRRNEDSIQRAVFQHITARRQPGLVAFAVPNGGARSRTEAAILKGLGVLPGVPDILLFFKGKVFALEIKTKDGRPTAEQVIVQEQLRAAGVIVKTVYGLNEALITLETWGLVRGKQMGRRAA